jgi:deazaflavin-dependent oxidoreductase (nitroreductase family)
MDRTVEAALDRDKVIDITTTGRQSGQPRRIEIWFHRIDGRTFITGSPGARSWYANLVASPAFTFHLKQSVQADLAATARPITDETERREVLARVVATLDGERDLDDWVARSPLVEVTFRD